MAGSAPAFLPPPQPSDAPPDQADFGLLLLRVRTLFAYVRQLTVWLMQQLQRVQWTLRYGGLRVQVVLTTTPDPLIFAVPFVVGMTVDDNVAGILFVNGVRIPYVASTPVAGQYTMVSNTGYREILLGAIPGGTVEFEWVMEAA